MMHNLRTKENKEGVRIRRSVCFCVRRRALCRGWVMAGHKSKLERAIEIYAVTNGRNILNFSYSCVFFFVFICVCIVSWFVFGFNLMARSGCIVGLCRTQCFGWTMFCNRRVIISDLLGIVYWINRIFICWCI